MKNHTGAENMNKDIMTVAVSACLLGTNCKYSGGNNANAALIDWLKDKRVIPVCPEVMGGLPTPRPPAEIVNGVVMNARGECVHEQFVTGARIAAERVAAEHADLVILQSRSPSCGVKQIYDGSFMGRRIAGQGIFAAMMMQQGVRVLDIEDFKAL